MPRLLRAGPTVALLLALGACTSVPFDYPREPSKVIPASAANPLGRAMHRWEQDHGQQSGFIALPQGIDALGARLALMENARASIDAQYFLLKPDRAGELFLGKLLRAADRGVRVRLLLDDIFTPRMDSVLAALDTHPNVEVRLFNPLSRQSPKAWNFLLDFRRINRRMHNKSFIVDGSLAIIGGRNIAEEYFELKPQQDFDDFEVLIIGAVVPALGRSFDQYWNSEMAVPMAAFGSATTAPSLDPWRERMQAVVSGSRPSPYAAAVSRPLLAEIGSGKLAPRPAAASVVYDPPDKLRAASSSREARTLANALRDRFEQAEREIILITPYFVPRAEGMDWIEQIRARGVRITVITNSLASNNHTAAHSGYARYRRRLLRAGVDVYEIKVAAAARSERRTIDPESVTLHTKAAIIDGRELFLGSLNFDPRSIALNTEVGVFIDSEALAGEFAETVRREIPRYTWQVRLSDKGALRWHYQHGAVDKVYSSEPETGLWTRFKAGFYRFLPIESQL